MLRLYNTLSRKKEPFRANKTVKLFVCGPTVYDFSHLGHARTYIAFDMIAKYLKHKGCDVFYLQNITDIDDKIIKRAKENGVSPQKLAGDFEKEYLKDIKNLKIDSVDKYARATDYIEEIISQVKRLAKKGYAYRIEDGIYYDISKFKNYGKLSKRTVSQAEDAISRVDQARGKKNRGDFCLWKFSKSDEPKWPSPWGLGRPGWHIEDTAITEKEFKGPQYDIHGGAVDLVFPHHEAEIAQMEAISGKKPMAKYWLHTGFLTIEGQKMSKSLGNFITIRDFINKNSARLLRYLVLKNYYKSPIDYDENALAQAKRELERIDEFVESISGSPTSRTSTSEVNASTSEVKGEVRLPNIRKNFGQAMDDDFNTPKALAAIFKLMKSGEKNTKDVLNFLKEIDKFLGFIFWKEPKEKLPDELSRLAKQRQEHRKRKEWQKADQIREKIKQMGWLIEDTENGPKLKKIS